MVFWYWLIIFLSNFNVLIFKLLVGLLSIKILDGFKNSFVSNKWFFLLLESVFIGVWVFVGGNKKFCK